jgi:hypothetical protein
VRKQFFFVFTLLGFIHLLKAKDRKRALGAVYRLWLGLCQKRSRNFRCLVIAGVISHLHIILFFYFSLAIIYILEEYSLVIQLQDLHYCLPQFATPILSLFSSKTGWVKALVRTLISSVLAGRRKIYGFIYIYPRVRQRAASLLASGLVRTCEKRGIMKWTRRDIIWPLLLSPSHSSFFFF